MPTQVQFRRGTAEQNDAFVGAVGEITYDTTNRQLRIHNGVTPGGSVIAPLDTVFGGITESLLPSANVSFDLGSSGKRWRDLYISGGTIHLGDIELKEINGSLTVVQAGTSTEAESIYITVANTEVLVNDRMQVANVNLLVNDRMQVANVATAISTAITNLVDAAPETLDTLNELAAALGDDANFASTLATNLGQKLGATATVELTGDLTAGPTAFSSNSVSLTTTLADTGTPTGTFGSASKVPVITVNSKGQITNISNTNVAGVTAFTYYAANNTMKIDTADGSNFTATIDQAEWDNYMSVANTQALVDTRLGATASVTLSGDVTGTASFSSNAVTITTDIADSGTPTGTFGSASKIPVITVGADGRITNISNTNVAGVTGVTFTAANNNLRISTADGATYDTTIDVSDKATWTALTTTNTAIRALVSDRLQVANATLLINDRIQVANATLLINDRMQVANTNLLVNDRMQVANTVLLVNDRMQVANVNSLISAVNTNLGQKLGATASVTLTGDVSGTASFSSNAVSITTVIADDSHNHIIGNVDGLQTALDTKATWTALTSTNSAIRTLVSDRLQVANAQALFVNTSGDTMTGFLTLHADPTSALHASTKQYVDNVSAGIFAAPQVRAATTANLTGTYDNGTAGVGATFTIAAAASLTIDNVTFDTLQQGLLIKDQTNAAHNGRYFLSQVGDAGTTWIFTRCGLCDTADEIPGKFIFVTDGDTNGQTGWVQHVDDPDTFVVGTDDIDLFQFSGAGTYTAGTDLTLNATQFSLNDTISANTTGSAAKLTTARSIALGGDLSGSANFDGSAGITITATVADDSHNHVISNVDGLQTALDAKATWAALTSTNTAIRSLISSNDSDISALQTNVSQKLGATASITLSGAVTGSGSFSGNTVTISTTATSDPTLTLNGDVSGSATFTNLGNATLTATVADDSHNHSSSSGNFTVGGDLTITGGDITLSGTGRIQGIDTVSAGTDAANKTYVDTAVANLVDSAPAALDTLNELAAALGDDANFATTIATNLGQKLGATASVTLTGDVTGTASFSANAVSITTTVADDSHNHVISNIDGLQTALDGKQPLDTDLTAIAALSSADGNFIVGSASGWVAESGSTARTSLGLGSLATLSSISNDNWSGTDLAVENGGTGASDAATARTNLGLAIGTNVQAYDADLTALGGLAKTDGNFIVGNGTTWVAESGSTARTSLGLGSLATLSSINNDNWSGTDLSLANGGTGASLSDPGADRILFWDDSASAVTWLTAGTNLTISGTTISSTDTNTTYSAGNGISLSGTTFSVAAGTGLSQDASGLSLSHLGIQSLTDPNDDRIMFWDDSAGVMAWLDIGSNLSISGTTISSSFTDTNTTYSAGNGISLSGTTFSVAAGTGLTQQASGLALSHLGIQNLTDPNADRIMFWDDSAGAMTWLSPGTGLEISGTALNITSAGATVETKSDDVDYNIIFTAETSGTQDNAYINASKLYFNPSSGTLNATDFNSLSDIKYKENVQPIENASDVISQLQGRSFTWKDTGKNTFGVIAQEIEQVLPELVKENTSGDKSVNYMGMIAFLIESNKELQTRLNALEKEIMNGN